MQFEIGKTYTRRDGKRVKIINMNSVHVQGDDYADFGGNPTFDGWRVIKTGRVTNSLTDDNRDLIITGPLKIR
jgi:hypothetical protein